MSRDESPRSRAALGSATHDREREAADLRAYADHREPSARERVIRRYLPLANSIARGFDRGKRVPLEDLEQIAALGLLKALDRYDPAIGAAFSTFAVPTMQGEIRRYFRDFTWTVRPPRDLQERAIRIEREREQLTNDLRRNPTARELAAHVGCTLEELLDASEAIHARASDSFDRPATTQEGDAATLGNGSATTTPASRPPKPPRPSTACWTRCLSAISSCCVCASARTSPRPRSPDASAAHRCTSRASSAPPSPNSSRTRLHPERTQPAEHDARPRRRALGANRGRVAAARVLRGSASSPATAPSGGPGLTDG
jgi:RNA polymerase sigma factor (sigma-70 family)